MVPVLPLLPVTIRCTAPTVAALVSLRPLARPRGKPPMRDTNELAERNVMTQAALRQAFHTCYKGYCTFQHLDDAFLFINNIFATTRLKKKRRHCNLVPSHESLDKFRMI